MNNMFIYVGSVILDTRQVILSLVLLVFFPTKTYAQFEICVDPPTSFVASKTQGGSGVGMGFLKWNPGDSIHVRFKGEASDYIRRKIEYYSHQWEDPANIYFVYDNVSTPDILIELVNDGESWSYIGKVSKNYSSKGEASMHYGWFSTNTPEETFRRTVLHEFGHALGLCHEHQHPFGNIQWDSAVVYGYYCEKSNPPRSRENVNQQIFQKLSGPISNHAYDPLSIMHYPIPPEFTKNRFEVKWNTELSAGDRSFIAEMYPRTDLPTTEASIRFDSIVVEQNVYRDGDKGLLIRPYFKVYHVANNECAISARFMFTASGQSLKDKNRRYCDGEGNVVVADTFKPAYPITLYDDITLFMPYNELDLDDGEIKIKFNLVASTAHTSLAGEGGYQYFTFMRGPICNNVELISRVDNEKKKLIVSPKFGVKNAKGTLCKAVLSLYHDDELLLDEDGTPVSVTADFTPGYDNAVYNEETGGLKLEIPYAEINLPSGVSKVKYAVTLMSGQKAFAISGYSDMTFKMGADASSNLKTTSIGAYNLRNRKTLQYVNTETEEIQCSAVRPGWTSAQWDLRKSEHGLGYLIQSKWRYCYLAEENGQLVCSRAPSKSAYWYIVSVPGFPDCFCLQAATGKRYLQTKGNILEAGAWPNEGEAALWYLDQQ